ncbi:MAG: hypothetical protein DCF22_10075 [Leptolyngbya sp.]|nr:MAG: hypothetical protein DCF22_10075 [Leptolyngbya sp.]
MTAPTSTEAKESPPKTQETARLLLALWELGANETALPKGKLPDRAKRPAKVFNQLVEDGAIKVEKQSSSSLVSLEAKGVERLAEELKTVDFALNGATTGAWLARGLLKWLQQMGTITAIASTNGKATKDAIASYEEFQSVALEVYDRLNRDYNLDNLVPIYRIRREIGDRVSRAQFDEWLLELQANDVFQLLEGSVEDSAPDKIEDSITTKISGLRCYAKRL